MNCGRDHLANPGGGKKERAHLGLALLLGSLWRKGSTIFSFTREPQAPAVFSLITPRILHTQPARADTVRIATAGEWMVAYMVMSTAQSMGHRRVHLRPASLIDLPIRRVGEAREYEQYLLRFDRRSMSIWMGFEETQSQWAMGRLVSIRLLRWNPD